MKNVVPFLSLALAAFSMRAPAETLPLPPKGHCVQVTVSSEKSQGVGWVIARKKSLYVLTPAHVTEKMTNVTGNCIDQTFKLTHVGSSPTYDLALFRVEQSPANLLPILTLPNSVALPSVVTLPPLTKKDFGDSVFVSTRLQSAYHIVPLPKQEDQSASYVGSAQKMKGQYHPLFPHPWSILSRAAIRPGMSGSALYDLHDQAIPIGMLVKVQANSDDAMAIPTESILQLLPSLFAGKDPWTSQYPNAPKLVYELKSGKRIRVLVTPSDKGRYTELCGDTGGLGDISASHWADGGSHWADGGKTSAAPNGELLQGAPSVFQSGLIFTSYYKSKPNCAQEGFRDSQGRIFSALKNPAMKISETEELFPVLHQLFAKTPATIGKVLAKAVAYNDDFDALYDTYCSTDLMGWKKSRWLSKGAFNFHHTSVSKTMEHYDINVNTMKVPVLGKSKYADVIGGEIKCDAKKKEISLFYAYGNFEPTGPLSMLISITRSHTYFVMQLGPNCSPKVVIPRQNLWSHYGKSSEVNTLFELDPYHWTAKLTFFDLNASCLINRSAPPALVAFTFTREDD